MKTRYALVILLAGITSSQVASADPLPNAWQITDSSTTGGLLSYTTNLTASQHQAATNITGGFRLAVNARYLTNFSGTKSLNMAYGLGSTRFLIWWNLDNNNLTADLDGQGFFILTTNGAGTSLYHTHEIIYDPTTKLASYVVDGQVLKTNWSPSANPFPAGQIYWGAGSTPGRGQVNYHSVEFQINELGTVASYNAGTEGNPADAPDPVTQGWTSTPSAPPPGATNAISPDVTLLPSATTLAADQFTSDSARLTGTANPSGSPTMAWFEWGTDTNYGNVTAPVDIGQGLTATNVSTVLGGLIGGPGYHYRLVGSNTFGLVSGTDQSFSLSFLQTTIPGLPGVGRSSAAWGDYDNDGWLDFLLAGYTNVTTYPGTCQLWQNTGSGFTNVTASAAPDLPGFLFASLAWGDYDNDGRLDFLVTGYTNFNTYPVASQLWRNTGSGFTNVPIPGLPAVRSGSVAWGDYDNDGQLDFLLTGATNNSASAAISQLWRNTGGGFSNVTASVTPGLPGVSYSSVAWGDYDNDGRLDFLLTGSTNVINNRGISQMWRNTGSGFAHMPISGLPGFGTGSVAWGDYDSDGRLDFLITGLTNDNSGSVTSQLWWNTGSGFTHVPVPGLSGVYSGSVAWGDYDNDGRLDFLLTGLAGVGAGSTSQLWRNTGSGFTHVTASVVPGLPRLYSSSVEWGDYDNDGRLDLLLVGNLPTDVVSQLWRNNLAVASNAPPAAPAGLSSSVSGNTVSLNWNVPADDLTPATGLNYNVRIGTSPGASDVLAPMAFTNGRRLLPAFGKVQTTNAIFNLSHLPPGRTYYWSVQALDTSFAGSPFATEQQFVFPPVLINPLRLPGGQFEFYFTNQTGLNFDVLVSTNVALPTSNWANLGPAISLGGGYYRFTDAGAIGQARRYYLLQSL
jgi:hypothetical protein